MKKFEDIIEEVESPFTTELIKDLFDKYLALNCDIFEFNKNIILSEETCENQELNRVTVKFSKDAIDKYSFLDSEPIGKRYMDTIGRSWIKFSSSKRDLNDFRGREPKDIYRIYINAKGKEKAKIIEEYINYCEENGLEYCLKYFKTDGTKDEIIFLSTAENLAINVELLENITEKMDLKPVSNLIGNYKGKFGIVQDYLPDASHGYSQTRLACVATALKKFILDNPEWDSNEIKMYRDGWLRLLKQEQDFSENIDLLCSPSLELQAYKNNIFPTTSEPYLEGTIPIPVVEDLKKSIEDNKGNTYLELIKNFHEVARVYGFSENIIFSKSTDEILKRKKSTGNFTINEIKDAISRNRSQEVDFS